MKKNKFLYKRLGPVIGKFLDKMFFTNFEKFQVIIITNMTKMIMFLIKNNIASFMYLELVVGLSEIILRNSIYHFM